MVVVILKKFTLFVSQDTRRSISDLIWSINQSMGIEIVLNLNPDKNILKMILVHTETPKRRRTHAGPAGGGTFSPSFISAWVNSLPAGRHNYVSAGSDAVYGFQLLQKKHCNV